MDDARYPIGPFTPTTGTTEADRDSWIAVLAEAPDNLCAALAGLNREQLDTPYRAGGWTVRQLAHHLPDSHLNSYVRCKWALTEDAPIIKPYFEERWAELPDTRETPIEVSLDLLAALHGRWVVLLRALSERDFARRFVHPESGAQTLHENLAYYAWHARHHTAQITALRQRSGWSR
jgi:uncharacterized damage-inducible protein DinB